MELLGLTVGGDLQQHRGPRNQGAFSELAVSSRRDIPDAVCTANGREKVKVCLFCKEIDEPSNSLLN